MIMVLTVITTNYLKFSGLLHHGHKILLKVYFYAILFITAFSSLQYRRDICDLKTRPVVTII